MNRPVRQTKVYYKDRAEKIVLAHDMGVSFRILGVVWGVSRDTTRRIYRAEIGVELSELEQGRADERAIRRECRRLKKLEREDRRAREKKQREYISRRERAYRRYEQWGLLK